MDKLKINYDLLPMKSHYLFINAGMSPLMPFLPIFGRQLGITSSMVGWIYFTLPFVGLVSRTSLGYLADKFNARKRILFGSILVMAAVYFSIQYVPSLEREKRALLTTTCLNDSGGYLVDSSHFSCLCSWEAMNQKESDSLSQCTMQCGAEPERGVMLQNYGALFNSTDSYNAACAMDRTLTLLNIPFTTIEGGCNDGMQCTVVCEDSFSLKDCLTSGPDSYVTSQGYWSFFLFMVLLWCATSVAVSLSDTICFVVLGARVHDYGKQRQWGSIGWGATITLAGFLVDQANPTNYPVKDYSSCHWLSLGFLLVDAANVLFLRLRQKDESATEPRVDEPKPVILTKLNQKVAVRTPVVIFMVVVVFEGMCMALVWNYLFWYLDDLAGAYGVTNTKLLMGLASFVQCFIGEIPFFHFSGYVIKKLGHHGALTMVMMAFGIRFLLYSLLYNPWISLTIEISQGITFSIFYASMTSYVYRIYPQEIAATMQGFVGGCNEIGLAIGSLIAGYMIDWSSTRTTFRIFGIGALVVGIVHLGIRLSVKSIDRFQGFNHVEAKEPRDNDMGSED